MLMLDFKEEGRAVHVVWSPSLLRSGSRSSKSASSSATGFIPKPSMAMSESVLREIQQREQAIVDYLNRADSETVSV